VLDKARKLAQMRAERRLRFRIEIDGGINRDNLADAVRAGCEWIVTGSSVFHTPDPAATVAEMRQIAEGAMAIRV
jgi:ribulose-phosphate 3-epimerase